MNRIRTLLATSLLLTFWALPTVGQESVVPEQWMTRGAGTLPKGQYGIQLSAGLPSAEARFLIPVTDFMEVNPVLRFGYIYGISLVFSPSVAAGAELKFRVFERGGDDIALVFGVLTQVYLGSDVVWDVWIGGLDIRYSHRWNNPFVGLLTGFRVSLFWGGIMEIPIDAYFGLECRVAPGVTLHLIGNGGFDPAWAGSGTLGVIAGFQLGMSYVW